MPVGLGATFLTQPAVNPVLFTSADTTVAKVIVAAPSQPWRLIALNITSTDTAAQVIDVFLRVGSTNTLIGSVTVPAGTGVAGVAPVEFFKAIMPDTEQGLDLAGNNGIQAGLEATMTAAKTITVTAVFGYY